MGIVIKISRAVLVVVTMMTKTFTEWRLFVKRGASLVHVRGGEAQAGLGLGRDTNNRKTGGGAARVGGRVGLLSWLWELDRASNKLHKLLHRLGNYKCAALRSAARGEQKRTWGRAGQLRSHLVPAA